MGSFTRDEFVSGMTNLSIDSVVKLKEMLPSLRDQALSQLDDIYMFAFHFLKDNGSQRLVALPGKNFHCLYSNFSKELLRLSVSY